MFHFVTLRQAARRRRVAAPLKTNRLIDFRVGRWVALQTGTTSVQFDLALLRVLVWSVGFRVPARRIGDVETALSGERRRADVDVKSPLQEIDALEPVVIRQ